MRIAIAAAGFALGLAASPAFAAAAGGACAPEGGLNFICGLANAEDLVELAGTRWIVASGMAEKGALHLIDAQAKTGRRWYPDTPAAVRRDEAYSACAGPPDPADFNAHGLSLRGSRLYVVNHGSREAVEVFEIDKRGAEPRLAWIGCAMMPDGLAANSVAAFEDGTILATVLNHPGFTHTDLLSGRNTGAVYEWRPGDRAFRRLPGTDLPGNNGIETSRDGREFFVVSSGRRTVTAFSRGERPAALRTAQIAGFTPDNIHWLADGRLIAAGMNDDEPACGGAPKPEQGRAGIIGCPRGYATAVIDPRTMQVTPYAKGPAIASFMGAATALPASGTLWIGSFHSDRLGYRAAP